MGKAIGRTYCPAMFKEQYLVLRLIAHGVNMTDFLQVCLDKGALTREDVIAISQTAKERMNTHDIT